MGNSGKNDVRNKEMKGGIENGKDKKGNDDKRAKVQLGDERC